MTDKQGNISSYPFGVGGALSGLLSTPFCWISWFFGGFGVEGFVSACGWAAVCGGLVVCGWVVGELYSGCFCVFIFCVISVFEFFCVVLVFVGVRWMPWCQELMKDVAVCDIPRGVDERALIRGFPNGVT